MKDLQRRSDIVADYTFFLNRYKRDVDIDHVFNSLATVFLFCFFLKLFSPPTKLHQPPNKRLDRNFSEMGWTDSWSIRLDWDMGGVFRNIFKRERKKDIPLSSMHVGC